MVNFAFLEVYNVDFVLAYETLNFELFVDREFGLAVAVNIGDIDWYRLLSSSIQALLSLAMGAS